MQTVANIVVYDLWKFLYTFILLTYFLRRASAVGGFCSLNMSAYLRSLLFMELSVSEFIQRTKLISKAKYF